MSVPCQNCVALQRSLSKSEEKIQQLKTKLATSGSIINDQKNASELLRDLLSEKEQKCFELLKHIQELEARVTQLYQAVEREEIARQDAQKQAGTILELLQHFTKQPRCTPVHIFMHACPIGHSAHVQDSASGGTSCTADSSGLAARLQTLSTTSHSSLQENRTFSPNSESQWHATP